MSWRLKYTKQAQKDSLKLASAGLKGKAEKLLAVLADFPETLSPVEKRQLSGFESRVKFAPLLHQEPIYQLLPSRRKRLSG